MTQASDSTPSALADIPQAVEDHLSAYIERRVPSVSAISPVVENAASVLADFTLSGGKRIRPTFAWLGWLGAKGLSFPEAARQPEAGAVMETVSALEFLQACALIHDDIIDSSDTRRGKPTVHRQFSSSHTQQSLRGHGETYGRSIAILVGDLALSWADDMFVESGLSAEEMLRAWAPWREMRTEVVCGQILDITAEAQGDGSLLTANRVNRYKTAAYTVERPLHIGAALANANADTIGALRAFGRDIGVAFQLRDDQLGVFGDPALTGKPSGDDLREGKRTVLMALTMENASAQGRLELDSALGTPLSVEDVERLRSIIVESGAPELIEKNIADLVSRAYEALELADISPGAKEALMLMAQKSTERQR